VLSLLNVYSNSDFCPTLLQTVDLLVPNQNLRLTTKTILTIKIQFCPSDPTIAFQRCRRQFSIIVTFVMTVYKAQGQTLKRRGIFKYCIDISFRVEHSWVLTNQQHAEIYLISGCDEFRPRVRPSSGSTSCFANSSYVCVSVENL
jgi:hypothetical protein